MGDLIHESQSDQCGFKIHLQMKPVSSGSRSREQRAYYSGPIDFHSNVAVAIAIFEPDAARSGTDPEILRHFSRSLHLVNERLSGRYALENSTLIAIIGLSQFERVQEKYEEALVHVQGLNRLALLRGGIAGFRDQPALMQKLFRQVPSKTSLFEHHLIQPIERTSKSLFTSEPRPPSVQRTCLARA